MPRITQETYILLKAIVLLKCVHCFLFQYLLLQCAMSTSLLGLLPVVAFWQLLPILDVKVLYAHNDRRWQVAQAM